jgi:hypothetical protein
MPEIVEIKWSKEGATDRLYFASEVDPIIAERDALKADVKRLNDYIESERYGATLSCNICDAAIELIEGRKRQFEYLRAEWDALKAENEKLRAALAKAQGCGVIYNRLYNSGYHAGHHDTVEGYYVDILDCDMETYHEDIVAEILEEYTRA